jgi:phenol 2-monooxygenase
LNQGRIERFILDSIQEHSDLEVERDVIAESLEYDENLEKDPDSYPITVKLRNQGEEASNVPCAQSQIGSGITRNELKRHDLLPDDWDDQAQQSNRKLKVEIVKAKYLIGCDGAHSWTRKQLDIPVEGSNTDHIWSVSVNISLSLSSSDI